MQVGLRSKSVLRPNQGELGRTTHFHRLKIQWREIDPGGGKLVRPNHPLASVALRSTAIVFLMSWMMFPWRWFSSVGPWICVDDPSVLNVNLWIQPTSIPRTILIHGVFPCMCASLRPNGVSLGFGQTIEFGRAWYSFGRILLFVRPNPDMSSAERIWPNPDISSAERIRPTLPWS